MYLTINATEKCVMARITRQRVRHQANFTLRQYGSWRKAKAAAGDCQRLTAKHGIQLFGGLGYTWENDIQLYVKRAKAGELLFGTTKDHRAQAGRQVMEASLAAAGATGEVAR